MDYLFCSWTVGVEPCREKARRSDELHISGARFLFVIGQLHQMRCRVLSPMNTSRPRCFRNSRYQSYIRSNSTGFIWRCAYSAQWNSSWSMDGRLYTVRQMRGRREILESAKEIHQPQASASFALERFLVGGFFFARNRAALFLSTVVYFSDKCNSLILYESYRRRGTWCKRMGLGEGSGATEKG